MSRLIGDSPASPPVGGPAPGATAFAPGVGEPEPRIVLHRIGWDVYEKLADADSERHGTKMVFVDGRLTLLSPSRHHDWLGERFTFLIAAVARGCGVLWEDGGSCTYRLEQHKVGVEGDKVFYFGAHAEVMLGSKNIDLVTQPPPDLAIEVELSHFADDAIRVYGRLGVPEVWRYDVRRESLGFWRRVDDGTYAAAERSVCLPLLEPGDVVAQLRLAEELGAARWGEQLGDWVRDVLLPRRGGGA